MKRCIMIKTKWIYYCTVLLILCCAVLSSCAKKEHKVYHIGIVSGADVFIEIADGFKSKMNELGYIEGKNAVYDLQKTNADPAAVEQAVQKFVADKVDLIFAFPTGPALAAKQAVAGTNIPVVFAFAGIEGNNLVNSVTAPGGNSTGVRYPGPELTVKRLEILCELMPQAKNVLIIYDKNYPLIPHSLQELHTVAPSLNISLVEVPIESIEELETALELISAKKDIGIDAILIMPELITQSPAGWKMMVEFAVKHKLPISGGAGFEVNTGAVFCYVPDNFETGRSAVPLADKILKGTPAGKIMVTTPPLRLRLNYKLAVELGLNVPEGLLNRADEIIR